MSNHLPMSAETEQVRESDSLKPFIDAIVDAATYVWMSEALPRAKEEGRQEILREIAAIQGIQGTLTEPCAMCGTTYPDEHLATCLWLRAKAAQERA